jgi:hypothetical protein
MQQSAKAETQANRRVMGQNLQLEPSLWHGEDARNFYTNGGQFKAQFVRDALNFQQISTTRTASAIAVQDRNEPDWPPNVLAIV